MTISVFNKGDNVSNPRWIKRLLSHLCFIFPTHVEDYPYQQWSIPISLTSFFINDSSVASFLIDFPCQWSLFHLSLVYAATGNQNLGSSKVFSKL